MSEGKHLHSKDQKKKLIARLKRIEGQIRGIIRMVEKDSYCEEILNQFASAKSALNGARDVLLKEHVEHCISKKMIENKREATAELMEIVKRISKG